jgi:uncharacterized protein
MAMYRFGLWIAAAAVAIAIATLPLSGATAQQQANAANRGVVELETSGAAGISVRIAEDLANLVDDGATRRVVPVVGKGSLQNLTDLRFLRGIDMAIVQSDVVDYARERQLIPGIDSSFTYIARLYNEEFHLLAGPNIKSVADLAHKKVNFDLRGSGTAITAGRLFDALKVPVTVVNESQEIALERLRRGEIAALAFVAGKPAPLFMSLKGDGGLHFLAVPLNPAASAAYAPTRLTAGDYPGLVPQDRAVDTVAVGSVLVAADLRQSPERYRNVANFVDVFFTGFQSLLTAGHHPKWQEVNLAAEFPGWRRYQPAEQWLQRNMQIANAPKPDDLKAIFANFIDEHRRSAGGAPMTDQEKEDLFKQYSRWQSGQPPSR